MTISTTTIKNSYSGNDSTTAFSYTFKITADSEMQVIIRSSTGTETIKTLTTHYTVSGAGDASGGTVTTTSGNTVATGETIILRRNTTQTQGMDLIENDPLPANTLETAVDKNLAISQELQEQLNRSFKVSKTNTITSPEFTTSATDRASKTLGFDSSGDLTTVADFLPAGGDSAQFTYSTTTADADPGSGIIRFNNTTLASATIAYVDDLEANGTNVEAWLQSFDDVTGNATNRGRIRVSKANTLDVWHVWKISGAVTDASGYTKLALTYIDGAGALADEDKVFLSFSASGEDGAIPGYYYKFDTSTSDADPGAGDIAFNNATYANVTEIYIDDADANGGATQVDTATWGGSTSTIKGFLHIVDINDSSTYARFKITAAVSDESGYNKITVVHLASNNTFSAADELSVHYTRTGLKGDTGSTGSTGSTGPTGDVSLAGTQTLTNKTLTSPKINEDVAVTSTATEINKLDAISRGSILYGNASAVTTVLTKGSANQILISDGTDIAWGANTPADNTVTLAKMAAGTDGNLITYDASGDPAAVATGNDGQVLTSTGAGSPPVFEDAAGGGGQFELVTRTAITSDGASVSFTSLTTAVVHCFVLHAIDGTANSGEDLAIQVSSDNGSSFITSGYSGGIYQFYSSGSENITTNTDMMQIADGFHTSGEAEGCHAVVYLFNIADSNQKVSMLSDSVHTADSSNPVRRTIGGARYDSAVDIDAIKFYFTSGNITGTSRAFITHYKQVIA